MVFAVLPYRELSVFSFASNTSPGTCCARPLQGVTIFPRQYLIRPDRGELTLSRYQEQRCFVCGKNNGIGLHLTFRLEEDVTYSEFVPQPDHQGYDGIVHGGILAALLDDAMANCLWLRGVSAVTAKMALRYREPVQVGTRLFIYGRLLHEREKMATAEGWITTPTGTRLVEASGTFFKLPPQ
jgi:uncharacterized protein (TIGR00369 family)